MNMREKVWSLLTIEEQTTLALVVQEGKSSWEAGEIMGKTHYKYLELKLRSERFYRLFTEYLTKNETFIPAKSQITPVLTEYITLLIEKRKTMREACNLFKDKSLSVAGVRDNIIINALDRLKKSPLESDKNLLYLIFEFDRWNNFRILPSRIQQPSAYKRRLKTKLVKQLKLMGNIHPFIVDRVLLKYRYITMDFHNVYFAPIVNLRHKDICKIIKVRKREQIVKDFSRLGVSLFEDFETANEFARLLANYLLEGDRNPLDGQKFWPKYRDLSLKAVNYGNINNLTYTNAALENAFVDLELIKKRKNQTDTKTKPQLTKESEFWKDPRKAQ